MRRGLPVCLLLLLTVAAARAADFQVVPEDASGPAVERVAPPTYYMQDLDRYNQPTPDAYHLPWQEQPVTRDTYMKWIDDSGHLSYADSPNHGVYGPRHLMPVLAKYVQTGDPKWGQACITMLKAYDQWMREEVKKTGWHSNYMHEPTMIGLYARHLSQGGLLDPQKDQWFKDMILFMNRTIHVWGTAEDYWRGPMHRAQGEGMMKAIAATWYPDAPEAAEWKAYSEKVWGDFWTYRDNPANDTGYYYGTTFPIMLGAEILHREEVFSDPEMRKTWERLMWEVTPDGAICPYGAHGGWNSIPGQRIWMLELLAARTGDGRYRYVAHKLMNYLLYQQDRYMTHHVLAGPETTEQMAIAYLLADDTVQPVPPEGGSRILYRKETLRLRNKEAATQYLQDLDPRPDKANICCSLIVTDKVMPAKMVLRSGWNPGDFFALIDLFPRHDPLNVPGIVGMTRWGAPLTQTFSAKGSSDENRLAVEDVGGTAPLRFNTEPTLSDAYYQTVEVPEFEDMRAATFATVQVGDYQGFPLQATREFMFIKNRFLVVRDIPQFEEGFLAQVGPVWNTQNVGPQLGDTWANTFFSSPRAAQVGLHTPPQDLLVYFAPQPNCKLQIVDRTAVDPRAGDVPAQLRYVWRGAIQAGQKLLFTQVYYPHAASRQQALSNAPGSVRPADLLGTAGADGIHVMLDTPEATVLNFTFDPDRVEWVVSNPSGQTVTAGGLSTDARYLYADVSAGQVRAISAVGATFAVVDGQDLFRQPERKNYEK